MYWFSPTFYKYIVFLQELSSVCVFLAHLHHHTAEVRNQLLLLWPLVAEAVGNEMLQARLARSKTSCRPLEAGCPREGDGNKTDFLLSCLLIPWSRAETWDKCVPQQSSSAVDNDAENEVVSPASRGQFLQKAAGESRPELGAWHHLCQQAASSLMATAYLD